MNMPGGAAAGGLQSYSALPPQSYSAAMQQQQTPIGMPNGHNSHGHRGVGQLMSMQQHGQQQPTTPMEPLPCSVGGVVALGAAALDSDTEHLSSLTNALALAGRAVKLTVHNYTDALLTLCSCHISQGQWKLPPPSALAPATCACFGAVCEAGELMGTMTYTDSNRHRYVLRWHQPSPSGGAAGTGLPNATISCQPDRASLSDGRPPYEFSALPPPTTTTTGGAVPELQWVLPKPKPKAC